MYGYGKVKMGEGGCIYLIVHRDGRDGDGGCISICKIFLNFCIDSNFHKKINNFSR